MRRRKLLVGVAALATGGIAGCIGRDPAGGTDGSPTPTPTDEPTPDSTPTPAPTPALVGREFTVLGRGCGNEIDEASVEFGDGRVTVTGTIAGSDACKTARLDRAAYDAGSDELRVVVETVERGRATACAQCITEIDYEAVVRFDGGTPSRVVVRHRGLGGPVEVATAEA